MPIARRTYAVDQGEGIFVPGTFKNELGEAIPFADLQSLTLTLYNVDDEAKTIINGRDHQNVKPGSAGGTLNNVTVNTDGSFVYLSPGADHPIVAALTPGLPIPETELHVALFEFTYGTNPVRPGIHEIGFRVRRIVRKGV